MVKSVMLFPGQDISIKNISIEQEKLLQVNINIFSRVNPFVYIVFAKYFVLRFN